MTKTNGSDIKKHKIWVLLNLYMKIWNVVAQGYYQEGKAINFDMIKRANERVLKRVPVKSKSSTKTASHCEIFFTLVSDMSPQRQIIRIKGFNGIYETCRQTPMHSV